MWTLMFKKRKSGLTSEGKHRIGITLIAFLNVVEVLSPPIESGLVLRLTLTNRKWRKGFPAPLRTLSLSLLLL